jgi:hypothetical protein
MISYGVVDDLNYQSQNNLAQSLTIISGRYHRGVGKENRFNKKSSGVIRSKIREGNLYILAPDYEH